MIFWLFAAVLTAAVLFAVLRPLLGERDAGASAAEYDLQVYRSQLDEIERDRARGQIAAHDADAAKAEIGRRMLAADRARKAGTRAGGRSGGGRVRALAPYAVALALPAAAFGLYLDLGRPGSPDMPLAMRDVDGRAVAGRGTGQGTDQGTGQGAGGAQGGAQTPGASEAASLDEAAETLRQRLEQDPEDLQGWTLLGRTHLMRRDYNAAVEAFSEALALAPENAELKSALGEARVLAADGTVTEPAKALFREVLDSGAGDPRAHYYLAEADFQAGRFQAALDAWLGLAQNAPSDAPYLPAVRRRARAAAAELGVDIADRLPEATQPPAGQKAGGGPSAADIEAARDMDPEARREMVRGMVEGLAARLEDSPMDFAGWQRLIRSYGVLGETTKAQAALDRALELFAEAPVPRRQLAALGREMGLDVPESGAAAGAGSDAGNDGSAAGPTAEDMQAAQDMSPEDRQDMVRGMVDGLAERLERNPDDLEGWRMLARSYRVLDRPEDALHALEKASELAPKDVTLLIARARVLRHLAGEQQTEESVALMRRVAELAPNNVEANWFLGLEALRAGDRETARTRLERAVSGLPAGSQERKSLAAEVEKLLARQADGAQSGEAE